MSLLAEAAEDETKIQRTIDGLFRPSTEVKNAYSSFFESIYSRFSKTGRAVRFVSKFMVKNQASLADLPLANFRVSTEHEDDDFVYTVARRVNRRLGKAGVNGWRVGVQESLDAGMINPGYGNFNSWIEGPSRLILRNLSVEPKTQLQPQPDNVTEVDFVRPTAEIPSEEPFRHAA